MGADFSGWATKNDIVCSDGRTIKAGAFKHHDKQRVPLVWQHMHGDPDNVLGYAILEHRDNGVYAYGYFNSTPKGQHAKLMVEHGDVEALSIYANNLTERGKQVYHGDIKEVSLVLAGANPGALIEHVNIQHGDTIQELDDEAIIYTGLELEHSDGPGESNVSTTTSTASVEHAEGDKTVKDIFDSMTDEQKDVVYFMIGEALEAADEDDDEKTGGELSQSQLTQLTEDLSKQLGTDITENVIKHIKEDLDMTRNVFETNGGTTGGAPQHVLSHSDLAGIVAEAERVGSFKAAFESYALAHSITDIDLLFPDAKAITNAPELLARRTEWVAKVIDGTKKSPFSRIKSLVADLTADEARAKGYVKGNLKKEEIIKLLKRVTTPTTIYKKQKLDRDDIVDITDLDVVAWLKGEMRLMLEEELARAVLIGDGREPDDDDKIDEEKIRPIARDADMYSHSVTLASELGPDALIEAILRARTFYKGTGTPTLYTTDAILTDMLLDKDKVGRRLYENEQALAAALRVKEIVVVEVMEDTPDILGIVVNLADYTIGADRGGSVSMFEDFDIDYNQQKYLIETRVSGALTKPKAAVVVRKSLGTVVTPQSPSFDGATNTITIPTVTGVVYYIDDTQVTGNQVITETTEVEARPATGYSFPHNTDADWTYVYTAG